MAETAVTAVPLQAAGESPEKSGALNYHGAHLPTEIPADMELFRKERGAVWEGAGAQLLGVAGQAVLQDGYRGFFGYAVNPATVDDEKPQRLVKHLASLDARQYGLELVFNTPKELAVSWALAKTPEEREALMQIMEQSVRETMAAIEQKSGLKLVYVSHAHCDARPVTGLTTDDIERQRKYGDPHLHMHVTIGNYGYDDAAKKWRSAGLKEKMLRDEEIVRVQGMFEANYVKQVLAAGHEITPTSNQGWSFTNMGRAMIEKFSTRGLVVKELAGQGATAEDRQRVALNSREHKSTAIDGESPPARVIAGARKVISNFLHKLERRATAPDKDLDVPFLLELAHFYKIRTTEFMTPPSLERTKDIAAEMRRQFELQPEPHNKQIADFLNRLLEPTLTEKEINRTKLYQLMQAYNIPQTISLEKSKELVLKIKEAFNSSEETKWTGEEHRAQTEEWKRVQFLREATQKKTSLSPDTVFLLHAYLAERNGIARTFEGAVQVMEIQNPTRTQLKEINYLYEWWQNAYGFSTPSLQDLVREGIAHLSYFQQMNPGRKRTSLNRIFSYTCQAAARHGAVIDFAQLEAAVKQEMQLVQVQDSTRTLEERKVDEDLRREIDKELSARRGSARSLFSEMAATLRAEKAQEAPGEKRAHVPWNELLQGVDSELRSDTRKVLRDLMVSKHGVMSVESAAWAVQEPLIAAIENTAKKAGRMLHQIELSQDADKRREMLTDIPMSRGAVIMLTHAEYLPPQDFLKLMKQAREAGARLLLLSTPPATAQSDRLPANGTYIPIGRSVEIAETMRGLPREKASPELLNGYTVLSALELGTRWTVGGMTADNKQMLLLNGEGVAIVPYNKPTRQKLKLDEVNHPRLPEDPLRLMAEMGLSPIRHYPSDAEKKVIDVLNKALHGGHTKTGIEKLEEAGKVMSLGENDTNRYAELAQAYWREMMRVENDPTNKRINTLARIVTAPNFTAQDSKELHQAIRDEGRRLKQIAEKSRQHWQFEEIGFGLEGVAEKQVIILGQNGFKVNNYKPVTQEIKAEITYTVEKIIGDQVHLKPSRSEGKIIVDKAKLAETNPRFTEGEALRVDRPLQVREGGNKALKEGEQYVVEAVNGNALTLISGDKRITISRSDLEEKGDRFHADTLLPGGTITVEKSFNVAADRMIELAQRDYGVEQIKGDVVVLNPNNPDNPLERIRVSLASVRSLGLSFHQWGNELAEGAQMVVEKGAKFTSLQPAEGKEKLHVGTPYVVRKIEGEMVTLGHLNPAMGKDIITTLAELEAHNEKIHRHSANAHAALAEGEYIKLNSYMTLPVYPPKEYKKGDEMSFTLSEISKAKKRGLVEGVKYEVVSQVGNNYNIAKRLNKEEKSDVANFYEGQTLQFNLAAADMVLPTAGGHRKVIDNIHLEWEVVNVTKLGQIYAKPKNTNEDPIILDIKATNAGLFEAKTQPVAIKRELAPSQTKTSVKPETVVKVLKMDKDKMIVDLAGTKLAIPKHEGRWEHAYISPVEELVGEEKKIGTLFAVNSPSAAEEHPLKWLSALKEALSRQFFCYMPHEQRPSASVPERGPLSNGHHPGREEMLKNFNIQKPGDSLGSGDQMRR